VSDPIILPCDCETAIDALDRAYVAHMRDVETEWLGTQDVRIAALKAQRAEAGIEIICGLIKIHQTFPPPKPPKPKPKPKK